MGASSDLEPQRRPVTIAEIAEAAGVSVPTVSKVINGRGRISPATRQRVEAAIQANGYQRRARATDRVPLLELVFHKLDSEWGFEIIKGVEQVTTEMEIPVVLSELHGRRSPGRAWIHQVLEMRPVAVIAVLSGFTDEAISQLESRDIPLVVIDPAGDPPPGVPSVGVANWSGGLAATRHLVALGHRRIAAIGGPENVLCTRARIDGYRTALEDVGVAVDPQLIRFGDFRVEGGLRHARALLRLADRPTAIFAGNDQQALGVYEAAKELGLSIPEDLSVVGFDDLPMVRWMNPRLTTIRQPLQEMAATAARLALQLGNGETVRNPRVELNTELVVRDSTAPPRFDR